MTTYSIKYLSIIVQSILLLACSFKPTDRGQQYIDGKIKHQSQRVNHLKVKNKVSNGKDFCNQVLEIKSSSLTLYKKNISTYSRIEKWLSSDANIDHLSKFGIKTFQMKGFDHYGNVKFTSYYTPIINACHTRNGKFKYPIYRMPPHKPGVKLPSRAEIYNGVISDKYAIAYSSSIVDNFMLDIQGSGYVNFKDGRPLRFLAYDGKNGWPYRSIGMELIKRGELKLKNMSNEAISKWIKSRHSLKEVRTLLETNPSFVFFKMYETNKNLPVRGATGVPLIAKVAVAADNMLVPAGTVLLAEIPKLNKQGKFSGKHEIRLMIALDVGGSIKGQHFDIYQGIGPMAAYIAGFYNHYGRVWILK